MNPLLANLRNFMLTMLVWLAFAFLLASLLVLTNVAPWKNSLFFSIPCCLLFGFVSASAYYVSRSLPINKRRFFIVLGLFGGAAFISGIIWLIICLAWNNISLSLHETWSGIIINNHLATLLFIAGCLLYLLSILAYDVLFAFEKIHQSQRREAASEILARDAELQMLRTQINPHFLFNSLNSISALTAIDPAGARHMTIELAQFFRQTLALSEKKEISLKEEITLCEHFLSIEKIRFGKKLQCEINIDPNSENCLIPPMLLQPLIENAIKHGIRNIIDGGTIIVTTLVREQWLYISIENPVSIQTELPIFSGTGTGLKNLKARINNLYEKNARLTWTKNESLFRLEITLPLHKKVINESIN
jgi:two-component system sensor histidine kinase AlgZ